MRWRHIVIEGFCFGEKNHIYPCGREKISSFCLSEGMCPHFAYADSSELEASFFAPLYKIIWQRILSIWETICIELRWIFWDRWPRQRKKCEEFFDRIPVVKCPEWDDSLAQADKDFPIWLKKANK